MGLSVLCFGTVELTDTESFSVVNSQFVLVATCLSGTFLGEQSPETLVDVGRHKSMGCVVLG